MKYIWKVSEAPTGPYRSFQKRGWPTAETPAGEVVATIGCVDDYRPADVKTGKHQPLILRVRRKTSTSEEIEKFGGFRWLRMIKEFATLDEAKAAFKRFVDNNPEHPFI
jgi:hypothetical protein